ncbi:MAG TPA: hypothetical protein VN285_10870 [Candidatus Deferrimicrobium sp.]|nr:hypothetical protein [Candidatus Deferrimicrobium sp.]
MQLSEREARHVLRARTKWHRAWRWSRNGFALLGLALAVMLLAVQHRMIRERHEYQRQLLAAQASARQDLDSAYVIPSNQYESVNALIVHHADMYWRKVDSLDLRDKVRGVSLAIQVLPNSTRGFQSCHSTMSVLTAPIECECDSFDLLTFAVGADSTVSVKFTGLAKYPPLTAVLQEGGDVGSILSRQ